LEVLFNVDDGDPNGSESINGIVAVTRRSNSILVVERQYTSKLRSGLQLSRSDKGSAHFSSEINGKNQEKSRKSTTVTFSNSPSNEKDKQKYAQSHYASRHLQVERDKGTLMNQDVMQFVYLEN